MKLLAQDLRACNVRGKLSDLKPVLLWDLPPRDLEVRQREVPQKTHILVSVLCNCGDQGLPKRLQTTDQLI